MIPAALKNLYNASTTVQDAQGKFRPELIKSLKGLAVDDSHTEQILKMIQENGDILRLDLKVPNIGPGGGTNPSGGFGANGGRRLQDQVNTITFKLLNNGQPGLTDKVFADEQPFRSVFPFVADPNQPFPPGHEPDNTQQ